MQIISGIFVFALVSLNLMACTPRTANRDVGVASGAVIGAGLGAAAGDRHGHAGRGAIIGGATGAVAGGLIGASRDAEVNYGEEDKDRIILKLQREELERQRREVEDLKRQQYYNELVERYKDDHSR